LYASKDPWSASGDSIAGGMTTPAPSSLEATHRALLERFRKTMNLVGPGPIDEHFDDAASALHGLQPTGRWVDLGSGAGFPGLVLVDRFPQLQVDLVDSRQKRCTFLEMVLEEARIPAERARVLCQRVEALPGATYDGVVSRAFAPPAVALEHAERLLVPGGTAVLFLQNHAPDCPEPQASDPRWEVFHVEHYALGARRRKAVSLHFQR